MSSNVKYHLSVSSCFARMAIQRQLEYPSFLVSWLLMIPIQYFAGILMLKVIVEKFQALNGWTFPQLAFVYGLGLLSHGLMVVLFIQSWNIGGMVRHGEFDRMLLRPANVFFQFAVMHINFIGLIDLIPGVIIFLYGCDLAGFHLGPINIIKLLLVVVGGALIRGAFFIITGSIAFWTKSSESLVGFSLNLMQRSAMYPLSIYPYIIQMVLTFIIPFGFICFYPACDFLGQNDRIMLPLDFVGWTPLVGGAMFVLANKLFNMGLKNYESSGS
ncbi:MAG: ABC-2 family transporter protein [Firmicutes bacterium]|nr:ABC-2 family transporter protein [Bacillota bacterium]